MYTVNHHGDGRVSSWLNSPPGAQEIHVRRRAEALLRPALCRAARAGWASISTRGSRGSASRVLVREAYEKVAPPKLAPRSARTIEISPPTQKLRPEDLNPMQGARGQRLLKAMRKVCLGDAGDVGRGNVRLADLAGWRRCRAHEGLRAVAYFRGDRLKASFWVGVDRQGLLTIRRAFHHSPVHGAQRLDRARRQRTPSMRPSCASSRRPATTISRTGGCAPRSAQPGAARASLSANRRETKRTT